jgi:hypothetical protein
LNITILFILENSEKVTIIPHSTKNLSYENINLLKMRKTSEKREGNRRMKRHILMTKDDGSLYRKGYWPREVKIEWVLKEIHKQPTRMNCRSSSISFKDDRGIIILFIRFRKRSWGLAVVETIEGEYVPVRKEVDLSTKEVKQLVRKFFATGETSISRN